jgi:hypothetical protein
LKLSKNDPFFLLIVSNGLRYPLVGGMRERRFAGTSFEPRKLPENAATPTSRICFVKGEKKAKCAMI